MRQRKGTLFAVVLLAILAVALWPAPDPLRGVETVALAEPAGELDPQIFDGLELVLGQRRIRLVSDPTAADALITVEPKGAQIVLDERGFRATVRLIVTKDGRRYPMELRVTVDAQGVRAELMGRRLWEFWRASAPGA